MEFREPENVQKKNNYLLELALPLNQRRQQNYESKIYLEEDEKEYF